MTAVWTSPFRGTAIPDEHVQQDMAMSSADVRCLPSCCPALEEVEVSLRADADLAALSQVTGMRAEL